MDQITVEATPRDDRGKNAARGSRRDGSVPAVLYGGKGGAVALSVNAKQLTTILRSETGHNAILHVKLPSGEQPAMVKDWQVDPVKGVAVARRPAAHRHGRAHARKIPVHTFGEPQGVKLQGGIFEMVTREVEIECLPFGNSGRVSRGHQRADDRQTTARRETCRSTRKRCAWSPIRSA